MEAASSSKRRRGGLWQRRQAQQEENQCPSVLFSLLMVMFAKGILSGAQVHELAVAAQTDLDRTRDGKQVTKLNEIAKLKTVEI